MFQKKIRISVIGKFHKKTMKNKEQEIRTDEKITSMDENGNINKFLLIF